MNSSHKILIVDDEPRLCDSMEILLSSESYSVKTATSGTEAIECLNNNKFDIALLDIGLPDMNGYNIADNIIEQYPNTSIIMLTGNASVETAIQAVKKNVYDFFRKPVDPELLLKTVQKALEKKQLELNLKESEFRFRQLYEATWEGIVIYNDGILVHANKQFYDMFGYSSAELMQKATYANLIVTDSLKPLKLDPVSDKALVYEGIGVKKNKTEFPIEIRTKLINYYGQVNTVAAVRDITERRNTEEERIKLQKKLSKIKVMEALGLMAGSVAHDLNNILSGVVSYPELILLDLPPDSKLVKPLKTIQKSGERAAAVVSDLMSIARISTTAKQPYSLNRFIKEYLYSPEYNDLKTRYPDIDIHTNIEPDLMNIHCSPIHIGKILMNLVHNGAESIAKKGTITIATENYYAEKPVFTKNLSGDLVVLTVSDNGPGISKNDMDRIFEPFYSRKVMGRSGTGLGLSVVWNTVNDHQGYIEVSSDKNKTSFKIYFKATRDKTYENKEEFFIENCSGKGENILIVDDQKSQREIVLKLLTKLGYKADAVSSGEEAVLYIKNHSVDLILLDMIMEPGINGLETFKRIKKIKPEQKAIIASGYSENIYVKEAQKLGAGQYIKKPYTLKVIGPAIKNEIKKKSQETVN